MDKLARGAHADALLNSEFFNDMMADLEFQYVEAWKRAETVQDREAFHQYIVVLNNLKVALRSIATTGAIARKKLEEVSNAA